MIAMTAFRRMSHDFACLAVTHGGGGATTALWQDKSRSLWPGWPAADGRKISDLLRCAPWHDSLHSEKSQTASTIAAPRAPRTS
jgi:hypothetical protein